VSVAVVVVSHGTVDDLDDLGAFVTNVRRGHPPSADLVAELRRRYDAVGGSPLNAINAEVARKLAARLSVRVASANRLWKPYARDVVAALAAEGATRIVLVPLAQHSAAVYAADARPAAEAAGVELVCAPNWGRDAALCDAFASRIGQALAGPGAGPGETVAMATISPTVIMTAHSLPRSVIDAGDPYEREVRGAAEAIAERVRGRVPNAPHFVVAFQSQGFASTGPGGRPIPWLGPDLAAALDEAVSLGSKRVVFAPVGFLADHVEILYDLDIEARAMAAARGLEYARTASLNADDDFIEVLARVASPLLGA
jgi:ferrochelatase